METQLNRVELIGVVGSTKESTCGDVRIVRFTLATNLAYKSKDGCAVIETTWHNVTFYPKDDMTISKGDKLHVIGRLRNQRYTCENGEERMSTEIAAYGVEKIETEECMKFEE